MAAGLSVVVAMPDNTPLPILGKVAALARAREDVHLELVTGTIREAGALLKSNWIDHGYFSVATFQEPGWRIEGKKTLGLELAEPSEPGGPWSLPEVVIYPTGGGTGVLGMWKAFDELEFLGLIDDRRPRVVCVQSEATRPLVAALENNLEDTTAADAGETVAYGLKRAGRRRSLQGAGHHPTIRRNRSGGERKCDSRHPVRRMANEAVVDRTGRRCLPRRHPGTPRIRSDTARRARGGVQYGFAGEVSSGTSAPAVAEISGLAATTAASAAACDGESFRQGM